jgi:putative cell wall-binding protein
MPRTSHAYPRKTRRAHAKKSKKVLSGVLAFLAAGALTTGALLSFIDTPSLPASSRLQLAQAAEVPTYFVPNKGQIDAEVDFYVEGNTHFVYLNDQGSSFVEIEPDREKNGRATTMMSFVDANPGVHPETLTETETVFSYFIGSADDRHAGIKAASAIVYRNLWDGIDLQIDGMGGTLKYTYTVAPGADPSLIKLRYEGAEVRLNDSGDLVATTPLGGFTDQAPTAWQERETSSNSVAVENILTSQDSSYIQSFNVGDYDPALPLTIDPIVLTWATFVGGGGDDDPRAITVDDTGLYVGAWSGGAVNSFPGGTPGFDTTDNGSTDSFLYKLSHDGTSVIYATYVGGSGEDGVNGLQVDSTGKAYFTSNSASTNYPTTVGAFDTTYNGGLYDGIIARLNAAGTSLEYSTFYGGIGGDLSLELAIDSTNRVYVGGQTDSAQASFPETVGPDLTYNSGVGGADNFVGRFDFTAGGGAGAFNYLGYIGGSSVENCCNLDVIVDGSNNAYVMGETFSDQATFPDGDGFGAVTGYDQLFGGGTDYYIARISSAGALTNATYLGGAGNEKGSPDGNNDAGAIELANGSIYAVGGTASTQASFPVLTGPDLTHNGAFDGFVARLSTDLLTLTSNGFFGGSGDDFFTDIDSDSNGDLYISNTTSSTEATLPLRDGPDLDYNGGTYDGNIIKLDGTDLSTVFSGYIGGDNTDWFNKIAVYAPNVVYGGFESKSTETTSPNGYGFYSIPGLDHTFFNPTANEGLLFKLEEVPAGVVITESGGSTDIVEGGATDTYDVVLISRPTFNVTVNITPNAQQTTDKTFVLFTPVSWDVPQTVTVTAVNDGVQECPHTGLITHAATSTDLNYDGIGVASVTTHIDEAPCLPPGIIVTESNGSTDISEIGPTSDDYNVVLTSQPTSDVVVSIFPNAQQTTNKTSLTFTTSNWNTPQQVMVTAVADAIVECAHTGLINHIADSSDPAYDGLPVAQVVPNITDQCTIIPGSDPRQQSIEVSHHRFPIDHTASAAILARDKLMADAFTGIPFASIRHAPLLLTDSFSASPELITELKRVLTTMDSPIYILGAEEAVTPAVYDQLRIEGFTTLVQLGGRNRLETAAIIANSIYAQQGTVESVFVTEHEALVDALGSGPAAGLIGADNIVSPILLNRRTSKEIDVHTDAFLKSHPSVKSLVLIGADSALPSELDATFTNRYPNLTSVSRLGGSDRFETNALIARTFFPAPAGMVVANGQREQIPGALSVQSTTAINTNFFAALLAGTVAVDEGWPLLIVTNFSLPNAIRDYIIDKAATIDRLIVVGDSTEVSRGVIDQIISHM